MRPGLVRAFDSSRLHVRFACGRPPASPVVCHGRFPELWGAIS